MVSIDEYADRAARQYSSYFPNHFVLIHSFLAFIFWWLRTNSTF